MTPEDKSLILMRWLKDHAPEYLELSISYVDQEYKYIQIICNDFESDTGIKMTVERMAGVLAGICFYLFIMKSPIEEI